MDNTDKQAT